MGIAQEPFAGISFMAVVTACGLWFILSNPILIEEALLQLPLRKRWILSLLLCLVPYFFRTEQWQNIQSYILMAAITICSPTCYLQKYFTFSSYIKSGYVQYLTFFSLVFRIILFSIIWLWLYFSLFINSPNTISCFC